MIIRFVNEIWLRLFGNPSESTPVSKFVDLAPTADADDAGIYSEALSYATKSDKILNIALTGPYGSGKSSVIQTFLADYPGAHLALSLASFLPDGEKPDKRLSRQEVAASKQEIERSILQQILYGVEADKLPFSRFKRIRVPKRSATFVSLLIATGFAFLWYVWGKQTEIASGDFFFPAERGKWLNYLSIGAVAALGWMVIHGIYTTSFGLSLKSISLKDVQIAPVGSTEDSILNKHLDEILYFFQTTKYDLVVIEDLDRFEDPDIFVTLRELNGLINASEGITRRVRFLYALRDDIFVNTDRTKFFEFIVPVIPIINHSNSVDKVLEHVRRLELDAKLDGQFVREVSRYLTDMRLIRNIFNEYVVYAANLKADADGSLDPNKLLAVIIYKNVIPADFAALHQQAGVLSKVLGRYEQYIAKIERQIRDEMVALEKDLEIGAAQGLRDVDDLRKVYAMEIISAIPAGYYQLQASTVTINIGDLPQSEALDEIIARRAVSVSGSYSSRQTIHLPDIEKTVDPTRSFADRKADIERKSAQFKRSADKHLRELKADLASLRTRRFNEVVRESSELIDELFAEVGESRALLRYLILEGYLDDTYYQYISLFHSGRLSHNDNNFLIKIRAYDNPPPDFPLDNIAEVIASMRKEDFGHHYVLNRFIVDHLLEHDAANAGRVADAADFIANNFDAGQDFFRSYYAKGARVEKLIAAISSRWPDFAEVALAGADAAAHAARILAYMPERSLESTSNARALRSFLSEGAREALAEGMDFEIDRLRSLDVEIDDVASLAEFPKALSFVAQEGLYRISVDNIRHIFGQVVGRQNIGDLETRHFSTLREAKDRSLLARVNADFATYVSDVLLALDSNTGEDLASISDVLAREEVDHDLRAQFLGKQRAVFPDFDDIPADFHALALQRHKIAASWENCSAFMSSQAYTPDLLTAYLNDADIAAALSRQPIAVDEGSFALCLFIVGNGALALDVYLSYVRQLRGTVEAFPDIDAVKTKILITERKVTFNRTNFESLGDTDLEVLFIAMNFSAYEAKQGEYALDDGFRARLLRTSITDAQKLKLIDEMDEVYVAGTPAVAGDIGPILDRSAIGQHGYDTDFVKAVIINSRGAQLQVSLLNKLYPTLSNAEVREVLTRLPEAFRHIAAIGKSPKIEGTEINRHLAVWLKERGIISSFGDTVFGDEIRIHTFRKEAD